MLIGQRIKYFRKGAKITQEELAKSCGISLASLKNYESGKREAPLETLRKISRIFGVPIATLIDSNKAEEEPARLKALYLIGQKAKEKTDGNFSDQAKIPEIFAHVGSITFSPIDYEIIEEVHKLNAKGQKTALERIRELAEIKKYVK
ncbi:helix-turn-helix domain-containing protein [Anaeromassilibacillus sp. An200]|uniref:helix-turn-helix domain-containing protein n=1 Tax=Anaeromassilibacillus sp. An200 TaxID=1965587 RepID=UPI000B3A3381|nr:helix-turn-helix transcriptional regulator [Anaeromassilibacillus sp. An200]OUP06254.1 hypothetical protein B5F35_15760 [Anaeromassilibacillus sp. An200]